MAKVLIAQGGGPTAVINQSMVGAVLESRKFNNVELVYGAFHGVRGIVDEEFLDLTQETTTTSRWSRTPRRRRWVPPATSPT
jgi:ATP-dependent phosphofructokinase / diphosphate-dependent phosphofructokinase